MRNRVKKQLEAKLKTVSSPRLSPLAHIAAVYLRNELNKQLPKDKQQQIQSINLLDSWTLIAEVNLIGPELEFDDLLIINANMDFDQIQYYHGRDIIIEEQRVLVHINFSVPISDEAKGLMRSLGKVQHHVTNYMTISCAT